MKDHFCNCPVQSCGNHPTNHEKGCDPCIKKNLRQSEIPACFFLKVSQDVNGLKDFSIESFVNFYLENNKS